MVFLTNRRLSRLKPGDNTYQDFNSKLKSKIDEIKSGKGYVRGSGVDFTNAIDSSVTCPGNIVSDISRLEVLMGVKRSGNNSPEIINEAADICMRLFQGGIMNNDIYRKLIDELVENHGY